MVYQYKNRKIHIDDDFYQYFIGWTGMILNDSKIEKYYYQLMDQDGNWEVRPSELTDEEFELMVIRGMQREVEIYDGTLLRKSGRYQEIEELAQRYEKQGLL